MDRFCFDAGNNFLEGEFLFPSSNRPSLMLYFRDQRGDTQFGSWETVYNSNLNCSERYEIAANSSGVVLNLSQIGFFSSYETIDGVTYTRSKIGTKVVTSRSRYFFIAVGNCEPNCDSTFCEEGVELYWSFNFTNGNEANFYFGADQSGMWETSIAFFTLYIVFMFNGRRVRSLLLKERKYHVTVKLLMFSIFCTQARLFCDMIVYTVYRNNGKNPPSVFEGFGLVFAGLAELALILMLMLIMKGWTIVRRKISGNGRMRLTIFLTVYMAAYFTCVLFYKTGVDPADVVYMYDTWPGYILIILRFFLLVWLWRANRITLAKYNSKIGFYRKFMIFASLWTICLPVLAFLNYAIDEYFRAKLLYALELGILAVTHATFIILYNPNFGTSFPFHATTSSMLHGATKSANSSNLSDIHLRQATEISHRIKYGINVLQNFARDLSVFLEEIDPSEEDLIDKDEDLPGALSAVVAAQKPATPSSLFGSKKDKRKLPGVQPRPPEKDLYPEK